ncbi:hypothetical protein GCM10025864_17660 [Luteimicrobium album]|uniref:Pyrimidine dimer DNA glycosylase /DNA-(Apurinic or apyrimidinic site) lyase n=1 Tax=Luteimicrobium album TaxID=1054550 RepID=A0ABQ6I0N6_9MICO|nr:pyrimidine dimer DNA glycosylase/endonuclease V [Luteimicrobium album]GMA24007.1 hypothetical protein GCM10025864_17660 [Luteimicrobium album]
MRLWSVHPRYLDRQGLTACWREALLAQAVLAGRTTGYRNHPQLERFRAADDPLRTVGAYLAAVADEASARGYRFDRARIDAPRARPCPTTSSLSRGCPSRPDSSRTSGRTCGPSSTRGARTSRHGGRT